MSPLFGVPVVSGDDGVGSGCGGYGFGVFGGVAVDVTDAFLVEDLVDGDEDASLLDVAEAVVDGGAKHAHGGREAHVGVDEWWNIVPARANLSVEDAIVGLEVVLTEEFCQLLAVGFDLERVHGQDELVGVVEVLLQEEEDHVAGYAVVAGVHGDLAEEIAYVGFDDGEGSESVPQVVEGEEGLDACARALVLLGDPTASELNGIGQVVVDEPLGEVEHVGGGEYGLALGVELRLGAEEVAIASEDGFGIGVPYDELLVRNGHSVELVEVEFLAGATASGAEGYLTQASYLTAYVGGILPGDDVDFVARLIGEAEAAFFCEFALEELNGYGRDDFLHLHSIERNQSS